MSRSVPRSARAVVAGILLTLIAALLPARPAVAGPTDYVTLSDGTSIAINVRMPDNFQEGKSYPTVFEMSGYDGGSADGDTPFGVGGEGSRGISKPFNENYVTVHASVRGTGCSSGEFDLFSWRSALDGRELIEWIGEQDWSNGEVGIYGHSYGGITGFMVAATQPPNLTAVSVSGLIDDMYRGMVYPGGVSNYGFPLLWTGGLRNVYDVGGGSFDAIVENQDRVCAEHRHALEHRSERSDRSGADRHRQQLVPVALADQLCGAHLGPHPHRGRSSGRADRPPRSVPPVRSRRRCAQAAIDEQRRSRHADESSVPSRPSGVDGSLDARRRKWIRQVASWHHRPEFRAGVLRDGRQR